MTQVEKISDKLFNEIMNFSGAQNLLERANKQIELEKKNRQKFRKELKEHQKAEFINGEVVMQSPVKNIHAILSLEIVFEIMSFLKKNPIGRVYHEKVLISLERNDFEPDICFFKKEIADKFKQDQMIFPPPNFIAEVISPSTEEIDRGVKFRDYEASGVGEYWIVDPEKNTIEQYLLGEDGYELQENDGVIISREIKGFEYLENDLLK